MDSCGWVGLIPARGGSKGIPRKNLALCGNKPLLAWTAEAALGSRTLNRVILSTDDAEIAEAGRALGLDVPFLRPAELSSDDTPMLPVAAHVIEWLSARGQRAEGVVLLQPTSPLRTSQHIDEAMRLLESSGAGTVVSIVEVPHQFRPHSVLRLEPSGKVAPFIRDESPILRRQDKPVFFARNGPAILAVRREQIQRGSFYGPNTIGFVMDRRSSIDIDSIDDLRFADFLIRQSQ